MSDQLPAGGNKAMTDTTRPERYLAWLLCLLLCVAWPSISLAKSDRPIALIEKISNAPDSDLQDFDYAFEGDKIDLRPIGQIVLSYFDSCIVETVTGGQVKIQEDGSKVTKGGTSSLRLRKCRSAIVALDDDSKEAGASIKRVSPFPSDEWQEYALPSPHPVFKWQPPEKAKDTDITTIKIFYVDANPTRLLWQGTTEGSYFAYPDDAPSFDTGMPYRAVAELANGDAVSGVFSIDPNLEIPDELMNRLVALD